MIVSMIAHPVFNQKAANIKFDAAHTTNIIISCQVDVNLILGNCRMLCRSLSSGSGKRTNTSPDLHETRMVEETFDFQCRGRPESSFANLRPWPSR